MRKHTKDLKKTMAMLLTLLMMLGLFPATALAASSVGHSIEINYQVLYLDNSNLGYSYGEKQTTTFVCKYTTAHSEGYVSHKLFVGDIKNAMEEATVKDGYQLAGWTKTASANPTVTTIPSYISTSNEKNYTSCTPGTTIYLVAKSTAPAAPTAPTAPAVETLLNSSVKITCTNDEVADDDKTYGLQSGTYSIGAVAGNASTGYTCEVTVSSAAYIEKYSAEIGTEHALAEGNADSGTITLEYKNSAWAVKAGAPVSFRTVCEMPQPELTVEIVKSDLVTTRPYNLGNTFSVTAKASDPEAEVSISCEDAAVALIGQVKNEDGSVTFTYQIVKITTAYVKFEFTATAVKDGQTATAEQIYAANLRNTVTVTLLEYDGTPITDAVVTLNHKYPKWNKAVSFTDKNGDGTYEHPAWDVSKQPFTNITVTLPDGRSVTLTEDKDGNSLESVLTAGTSPVVVEYTFPAYEIVGQLYVNGVRQEGLHYEMKGRYGTAVDYFDMLMWAANTCREDLSLESIYGIAISDDGAAPEAAFGQDGSIMNEIQINVSTIATP